MLPHMNTLLILEMAKTKFNEKEALQYCFEETKKLFSENRKLYNRFSTYKQRWNDNKLGERAKNNILTYFGFTLVEVKKVYKLSPNKE